MVKILLIFGNSVLLEWNVTNILDKNNADNNILESIFYKNGNKMQVVFFFKTFLRISKMDKNKCPFLIFNYFYFF